MRHLAIRLLPLGLAMAAASACAADLGVLGPTYGIAEPHLLDYIQQRLRDQERNGELQRLMREAQSRGIDAVKHPTPVLGLRATETARSFYVDPSFTLDRNIVDAHGRLLFPAGTRTNPLDVVSLSRQLLFFDARDSRQLAHARTLMTRYEGHLKPILTGGSYLELMKAWQRPVYFDQQGTLIRRFGIRQLPALVSQDGRRLRVDELALP
ncbi:MAG: type-F conjugative transfer system protein TraW [Burkholderiales bacterium]|nr:type-F conjugative transfer system protein TraW [Burkholderiales bacterium]